MLVSKEFSKELKSYQRISVVIKDQTVIVTFTRKDNSTTEYTDSDSGYIQGGNSARFSCLFSKFGVWQSLKYIIKSVLDKQGYMLIKNDIKKYLLI
jgi:hypothetical protein